MSHKTSQLGCLRNRDVTFHLLSLVRHEGFLCIDRPCVVHVCGPCILKWKCEMVLHLGVCDHIACGCAYFVSTYCRLVV